MLTAPYILCSATSILIYKFHILVKLDFDRGGGLKSKRFLDISVTNQEKKNNFKFKVAHFLEFLVEKGTLA